MLIATKSAYAVEVLYMEDLPTHFAPHLTDRARLDILRLIAKLLSTSPRDLLVMEDSDVKICDGNPDLASNVNSSETQDIRANAHNAMGMVEGEEETPTRNDEFQMELR